MAIYHTYRPQRFAEVVGQKHVTQTLSNALKRDKIGHAYLLSGPRGTGKTTTARLLAKAVNCVGKRKKDDIEPCNECANCESITALNSLDLIEIDAASNRGIDEIRELRSTVQSRPSQLKKRVYIIDEVHMLTTPAFNALLKTLEEPPDHVLFILATTEPFNIPLTISSRCQRFDFHFVAQDELVGLLSKIAEHEKVRIDSDALALVARLSEGAVRDSLSMLEQLFPYADEQIDLQRAEQILGVVGKEEVSKLYDLVSQGDAQQLIVDLEDLATNGWNMGQLTKGMIEYGRNLLLLKTGGKGVLPYILVSDTELKGLQEHVQAFSLEQLVEIEKLLMQAQVQMKRTDIAVLPLEMALLQAVSLSPGEISSSLPARDEKPTRVEKKVPPPKKVAPPEQKAAKKLPKETPETPKEAVIPAEVRLSKDAATLDEVVSNWEQILQEVKPHNHSIEALLKAGTPVEIDGNGRVVLEFYYKFHKEQIEKRPNRKIVEDCISLVLGKESIIVCRLGDQDGRPQIEKKPQPQYTNNSDATPSVEDDDPVVVDALRMMGGKVIR